MAVLFPPLSSRVQLLICPFPLSLPRGRLGWGCSLIPFKRFVFPTFIPLFNPGKGWACNFCPLSSSRTCKRLSLLITRSPPLSSRGGLGRGCSLIPFKRFVIPTFIPPCWACNFCPLSSSRTCKSNQKFALRSLMPDFLHRRMIPSYARCIERHGFFCR
jgi:hypothetical protein